jgi:protein-S-isoprenylcysteine O-methyltransferase Ste14/SAM-dependent methyltransferase
MHESTLRRFNSSEGAEKYAAKFQAGWVEHVRDLQEQKFIASLISIFPAEDLMASVIDIPCGIGRFYPALRRHAPQVVQADWSLPMLQIARTENAPNALGYVRALATELPFPEAQFDLVLSVRLCHHLPTRDEQRRYIEEVLRISRKWVVLSYLDTDSPHNMVRSTMRRIKGKPLKWSVSGEEVARIAAQQGFTVMNSMLLSKVLSGQRYDVLMRTHSQGLEAGDHETAPVAEPGQTPPMQSAARVGNAPEKSTAELGRVARFAIKWRGLMLASMMIFALFSTVGDVERDSVVLPIGLTVFLMGALLRFWSQLHLHQRLRLSKTLTTTGPYAWVRNPMYLGNIAILTGLCIFSEVVYFAPFVSAIAIWIYALAVKAEEADLLRKYGQEYEDYKSRVPRWLPHMPASRHREDVRHCFALTMRAERYTFLIFVPYALFEYFFN